MLTLKSVFFPSLFFFTFIKRLFSSSLLSAIRKQCYLHIWCYWFSPSNPDSSLCFIQPSIFHDVLCIIGWKYTALTYSFPDLEPVCCSNSSNYCFLNCKDFSGGGQVVWYSHLLKNFPVCCDPYKGFSIVNEVDVFLKFSCSFNDPADVGNLLSCSSTFSKSSLKFWKFLVHLLLNPHLENFEHYFASMWDERNCVVVWIIIGIAFLWDWNENWPFPVLWPLLSLWNLQLHSYWVQNPENTNDKKWKPWLINIHNFYFCLLLGPQNKWMVGTF